MTRYVDKRYVADNIGWTTVGVEGHKAQGVHLGSVGRAVRAYGLAHPPATSTHSARQLPSLPSTSTMSVSQRHRQPTPFSLGVSHSSQ